METRSSASALRVALFESRPRAQIEEAPSSSSSNEGDGRDGQLALGALDRRGSLPEALALLLARPRDNRFARSRGSPGRAAATGGWLTELCGRSAARSWSLVGAAPTIVRCATGARPRRASAARRTLDVGLVRRSALRRTLWSHLSGRPRRVCGSFETCYGRCSDAHRCPAHRRTRALRCSRRATPAARYAAREACQEICPIRSRATCAGPALCSRADSALARRRDRWTDSSSLHPTSARAGCFSRASNLGRARAARFRGPRAPRRWADESFVRADSRAAPRRRCNDARRGSTGLGFSVRPRAHILFTRVGKRCVGPLSPVTEEKRHGLARRERRDRNGKRAAESGAARARARARGRGARARSRRRARRNRECQGWPTRWSRSTRGWRRGGPNYANVSTSRRQ